MSIGKSLILALISFSTFFLNPYRCCRRYFKKKRIYGETPIATYEKIFSALKLSKEDIYLELGSGRGRGCFLVADRVKKAIGVELVPFFYGLSRFLAGFYTNVTFMRKDMTKGPLPLANAIYLYGTDLEDSAIEELLMQLSPFPKGTKIVTISYPLTDYSSSFVILDRFLVSYPWGRTFAYLHEKKQAVSSLKKLSFTKFL